MKKTLSIILSLLLIMCSAQIAFAAEKTYDTPANAYVGYDKAKIAADDKQYIDSMSYDMIAGLLLDWVDGKIAEATQDFQSFEVEVLGQSVAINLDVSSLDGILSYAGYLSQLGGDFANLDITALNGLSRAGGDINFIYGIIQFVADNAEVFGKVFQWEEGQTFDFGLVGQYIEGLEDTNEIKIFYNDYLIGNDIQEKFIAEIAREMGYTVEKDAAGERVETFDEILSNGILNCVADFFKTNNLLSDAGIAQLKAYDLRTEDIYYHFKNLAALVQSDNQVKLDTYLLYIMDSVVRGAMKVMFGYAPVEGEAVSADVVAEFNAAYADLAYLYTISGGTVYFKATSGYAVFKLDADGTILEAKNITWENTMGLTFEVPAMTIYSGGAETTVGGYSVAPVATYTPSENYVFEIYSTYAEMLSTSGLPIAGTTVPDTYAPVMVEENAKAMSDLFAFTVSGITPPAEVVITFAEIEEFAEQKALEMAQQMTQGMNIAGMTPTVTGVDVTLNYQGYATEDEFITVVTGSASANIAVNGIALNPLDVSSVISNPIATIVLDNLSGNSGVADALALLNMLNSDFDVDMTLLDFAGN